MPRMRYRSGAYTTSARLRNMRLPLWPKARTIFCVTRIGDIERKSPRLPHRGQHSKQDPAVQDRNCPGQAMDQYMTISSAKKWRLAACWPSSRMWLDYNDLKSIAKANAPII